jgi:hypothetical protein
LRSPTAPVARSGKASIKPSVARSAKASTAMPTLIVLDTPLAATQDTVSGARSGLPAGSIPWPAVIEHLGEVVLWHARLDLCHDLTGTSDLSLMTCRQGSAPISRSAKVRTTAPGSACAGEGPWLQRPSTP